MAAESAVASLCLLNLCFSIFDAGKLNLVARHLNFQMLMMLDFVCSI
jgi:hypothetical protein